jgi:hypothetical protein
MRRTEAVMAEFSLMLSPLERDYLQGLVRGDQNDARIETRRTDTFEPHGKEAMRRTLLAKLSGAPRETLFPAAMHH